MHAEFDSIEMNLCCQITKSSSAILCQILPKTLSGIFSAARDLRVFSKRSGSFNLKAAVITCSKATKKDLSCFPHMNGLLAGMRLHKSFNFHSKPRIATHARFIEAVCQSTRRISACPDLSRSTRSRTEKFGERVRRICDNRHTQDPVDLNQGLTHYRTDQNLFWYALPSRTRLALLSGQRPGLG